MANDQKPPEPIIWPWWKPMLAKAMAEYIDENRESSGATDKRAYLAYHASQEKP